MKRTHLNLSTLRLIGLLLLLGGVVPVYAGINATLSRSTTGLDQPVKLSIQIKGENEASPDLSAVKRDFEILGRSQQQSISIINGQVSKTRGLTLTLLPKRLGRIEIAPIPVGSEASSPLTLEVVESIPGGEAEAESTTGAFIELELNRSDAYLQEEVILTVRLYEAADVRGESLTEPEPSLADTLVRLLSEEQYQAEREGQTYQVVERRYAVYAYQTGQLRLDGVRFRGRTGSARNSLFDLLRDPFKNPTPRESRIVRAQSDAVELNIKPIPASFSGERWLPARNLQIVESGLSGSGPNTAGRPVSRHIMVFADGLTSAQLPPIELELPAGVKQYPERPQVKDNQSRSGISGSRQTSVTLVATEPGSYELPAIEIPWWNTETNRQEVARLPAVTLEILPDLAGAPRAAAPQPHEEAPVEEQPAETTAAGPIPKQQEQSAFPRWLVWLLGVGWLVTLLGWWWSHRNKPEPEKPELKEETEPSEAPDPLSEILDELDAAYLNLDADAARQAWLRWGQQRWPDNPPSNLNRLAQRCPGDTAQAVTTLDRAFYSPVNPNDWSDFNPRELLQMSRPVKQPRIEKEKLAPLNP